MLDVAVRGGDVVDGSGGPRRRADVGIVDDRIVEVGQLTADAQRTIDATGKVVTPGFIDVHTHYDAQVFWDGGLTPSPLFGFTTVFAGNCGFSIAPLPGDAEGRAYVLRMLSRVEGIPRDSLEAGVPWSWDTTSDYLDAIEGRTALNMGFMIGHSTLRRCVMGADSVRRPASDWEVAAMTRHLSEGLEAGAMGFSSSWARTHNDAEGEMVPSRHAGRDELVQLSSVLAGFEGTSLEFIPMIGPSFEQWALELMGDMSSAAQSTLNWNLLTVTAANYETVVGKLEASQVAAERGGRVFGLQLPKVISVRLNFRTGFVLDAFPGWDGFLARPADERLAVLSDPAERARLDALAQLPENPLRRFANWAEARIFDVVAAENESYRGRLIGEVATEEGRAPFDVLCDIVVADELGTTFGEPPPVDSRADWEARLRVWRDGRAVIGGSDAGAHIDVQTGFDYPTRVLQGAVRQERLLSLEEAVHHFTDVPARLYGLRDRGRIEKGWYADVVVLDPELVADKEPRMVYDLPRGAGRLVAEVTGIEHVLVNGQPIVDDGSLTAGRPGTVLRRGRDSGPSTL